MFSDKLLGGSLAAVAGAGLLLASASVAQAGTLAAPVHSTLPIQTVDCAVGLHIGPLGACVGDEEPRRDVIIEHHEAPPPVVIERRAVDAPPVTQEKSIRRDENGCVTRTERETNGMGDSAARSESHC